MSDSTEEPLHETYQVSVTLNGRVVSRAVEPRVTLADFLRHDLGLTGTHLGCEHGICGACTVLIDGEPARACLVFAPQVDGSAVQTIEGLAEEPAMAPVLEALSAHHGLQCGFCTPGFVALASTAMEEQASRARIRELVSSNLCRCTGYQGIVDAFDEVVNGRSEDDR